MKGGLGNGFNYQEGEIRPPVETRSRFSLLCPLEITSFAEKRGGRSHCQVCDCATCGVTLLRMPSRLGRTKKEGGSRGVLGWTGWGLRGGASRMWGRLGPRSQGSSAPKARRGGSARPALGPGPPQGQRSLSARRGAGPGHARWSSHSLCFRERHAHRPLGWEPGPISQGMMFPGAPLSARATPQAASHHF